MIEKYYCGPKGTPKYLRSNYFAHACKAHDKDYKEGAFDRKLVDQWFLDRMLKNETKWWRRAHAYLLYKIVRIFGWKFYAK
tara:strand:- start:852 stop:1094 length:243 start_codon:yes stop_codon:yes gene_type:complete